MARTRHRFVERRPCARAQSYLRKGASLLFLKREAEAVACYDAGLEKLPVRARLASGVATAPRGFASQPSCALASAPPHARPHALTLLLGVRLGRTTRTSRPRRPRRRRPSRRRTPSQTCSTVRPSPRATHTPAAVFAWRADGLGVVAAACTGAVRRDVETCRARVFYVETVSLSRPCACMTTRVVLVLVLCAVA